MTRKKKVEVSIREVDDEDQDFEPMSGPELKHTLRKMIRDAIRWQNKQVLFTCRQCCFYQETDYGVISCNLDDENELILGKRMPTQMPECFTFDPLMSAFAGVLDIMHALGVEFHGADKGWATIVGRIAKRADRFGYVTGVKQRNLDKYGS